MKAPVSWLKDFVDIDLAPEKLGERLVSVGFEIEEIATVNGEAVLDIAITANRQDCHSIFGIAREIAAVTGKKLREPDLTFKTSAEKIETLLTVDNKNLKLCPRYLAAAVKNVKVAPSPKIIAERLSLVGIRPINNLVDVTNYVLVEIGQPMHAFDLEKLSGGKIVIRNAKDGERIKALDGKDYNLTSEMLAICDAEKPVAIAGIMGGEYSSVSESTKTVVLESAKFVRDSVRRTSRALALHSDSSARYEKSIDFLSQEVGLKRALNLFQKYGWGEIVGGTIDIKTPDLAARTLTYNYGDINKVIGVEVPKKDVLDILNRLFLTTTADGDKLTTTAPAYRLDFDNATVNDIAEEVIRFYGYSNIKPRLQSTLRGGKNTVQTRFDKLKSAMKGFGAHEICSYSFINPKAFDILNLAPHDLKRKAIALSNPLSADWSVMRTTLAYSMLKTVSVNLRYGNKKGRLFEVAAVYLPDTLPLTKLPTEKQTLCLAVFGEEDGYYKIKAVIDALLNSFNIEAKYERADITYLHPTRGAEISVGKKVIGYAGVVHPDVIEKLDLDKSVCIAELDAEFLTHTGVDIKPFKEVSKYQAMERDLALITPFSMPADELLTLIRNNCSKILDNLEVFDEYVGGQIPKGMKSLAVKLVFRDLARTLTDAEVNAEIEKVKRALDGKNVTLR